MRWLPSSLFGRLVLVLVSGLVVTQLVSVAINLAERDSMLMQASGMRSAQRIADAVKLLDSVGPADRPRVAAVLNSPPLALSLHSADAPGDGGATSPQAAIFAAVLRAALGDDRPLRVSVRGAPRDDAPRASPVPRGPGMGMGMGMHRGPAPGMSITTQVALDDGTWVTFDSQLPRAAATFPWRLLATLAILLAAVLALSYVAVRWITRPLNTLAAAADELGRDINRPPLPETGPLEVRRAAHAFNTMQSRLARLLEDRMRILAAMSHDLKTPITRLRLRAELLDDEEARTKIERDLQEMETLVTDALAFMRGVGVRQRTEPVDIMGLLEQLRAQNEDMGRTVTIRGRADAPYPGVADLLRRCLSNLVDNAVLYGAAADVAVEDAASALTVRIADRGPGIPADKLEAVFEPFVRLEGSRSRDTGGTGLGLSIARNIARAHGGDVTLRNREGGGLEAIVTLPRGAADGPT
jgi:signal transduction histidine kinase